MHFSRLFPCFFSRHNATADLEAQTVDDPPVVHLSPDQDPLGLSHSMIVGSQLDGMSRSLWKFHDDQNELIFRMLQYYGDLDTEPEDGETLSEIYRKFGYIPLEVERAQHANICTGILFQLMAWAMEDVTFTIPYYCLLVDCTLDILAVVVNTCISMATKPDRVSWPKGRVQLPQVVDIFVSTANLLVMLYLLLSSLGVLLLHHMPNREVTELFIANMSFIVFARLTLLLHCWIHRIGHPKELGPIIEECCKDVVIILMSMVSNMIGHYLWWVDPVFSICLTGAIGWAWFRTVTRQVCLICRYSADRQCISIVTYIG
jgi:hypothetical protein